MESPFAGKDEKQIERNLKYARACMRDCFLRGEAPFASHLLYTQEGILDDKVPEERKLGIDAGLLWGMGAKKTVVYTDLGITKGMRYGINKAKDAMRPFKLRKLPPEVLAEVLG